MFRGTRPKLSLSVPSNIGPAAAGSTLSINVNAALAASALVMTPRSPLPPSSAYPSGSPASSITPLTQAARNAILNQKGFATLQVPTFSYINSAANKSILKRDSVAAGIAGEKSLRFNDVPKIDTVSPLPPECHGGLSRLSKDERRWRRE